MSRNPSTNRNARIKRAEKRVVNAAMHILDKEGWAFQFKGDPTLPIACRPGALRGLEAAISHLRDVRKSVRARKRK